MIYFLLIATLFTAANQSEAVLYPAVRILFILLAKIYYSNYDYAKSNFCLHGSLLLELFIQCLLTASLLANFPGTLKCGLYVLAIEHDSISFLCNTKATLNDMRNQNFT